MKEKPGSYKISMIKIRKANESDTGQLEELFLITRRQTFHWKSPDRFKLEDFKQSTAGETILIAEDENSAIVGFISVWEQDAAPFIHHLFVAPNHQRKGIGQLLLRSLMTQLPLPYRLKCVTQNKSALAFYQSQGWIEIGRGVGEDGDYVLLELSRSANHIQTGLQKELFLESMHLIQEPGWEFIEEGDLIAFKTSVAVPFMNFVYGNVTLDRYKKIKAFYAKKPFFWMLSETQEEKLLLDLGFTGPDLTFEMGMNLADYHYHPANEAIEVREALSPEVYSQWINVAAGWLNIDPLFVDQFFTPWVRTGKYIPYLGFYEGVPAATSLPYLGNLGASLYCLGTLPTFRNRGLGMAVTHACLKAAKDKDIGQVVLYGSKMGRPMYKKIGFELMQTIREYSCAQP